jgi:p-cumate 2,3-dioxygenase alpha subunit
MDSAEPLGGWKIMKGTAKFNVRANWKLLAENSIDNYHFRTVHRTYSDYLTDRRERIGAPAPGVNRITNSRSLVFENGHVAMLTQSVGRAIANPSPIWSNEAAAETLRLRDELVRTYGEERGQQMAEVSRFLIIFPNHAFHDTQSGFKMRQWWPTAPGEMEVTQWEFIPRREHKDIAAYRLEGAVIFQGPGGFGTPDDIEALESCQIGFGAPELEWSDLSRGMQRLPRSDDELAARGFWRQWHALIQGREGAERMGDRPCPEPAIRAKEARA